MITIDGNEKGPGYPHTSVRNDQLEESRNELSPESGAGVFDIEFCSEGRSTSVRNEHRKRRGCFRYHPICSIAELPADLLGVLTL